MNFDLKTTEEDPKPGNVAKITKLVEEKAELCCRMFLGKFLSDFVVAETDCYLENPAQLTAVYDQPLRKRCVCKFLFFDYDEIVVDGGLVKHAHDEKIWIYQVSTAFLDKNYDRLKAMLQRAAEEEVNSAKPD